jgi:hypothetical protein
MLRDTFPGLNYHALDRQALNTQLLMGATHIFLNYLQNGDTRPTIMTAS